MRVPAAVLLGLVWMGCKHGATRAPVDPEFDDFETKWLAEGTELAERMRERGKTIEDKDIPTSYRTVFVGRAGVIIDRKIVAKLDALDAKRTELVRAIAENAKLAPSIGMNPSVVIDLDGEAAAVAIATLRLFVGQEMLFLRRNPASSRAAEQFCSTTLRDQPRKRADVDQLSILLDKGRIWVGLSRVLEFYDIADRGEGRDFEKLEATLKERKASAMFADRYDIELGARAGSAADVVTTFDVACKVGFYDLAVLPPDQLSAVPQL